MCICVLFLWGKKKETCLERALKPKADKKKKKQRSKSSKPQRPGKRPLRPKAFSPLSIYNVVYTVQLDQQTEDKENAECIPFDLNAVAMKMFGRYSKLRFPAASFRSIDLYGNKCTFCLFRGGKGVFTGLTTKVSALLAQHTFATMLEAKQANRVNVRKFKLENIVASMALGRCVDIAVLSEMLPNRVKSQQKPYPFIDHEYAPELFPGLRLWLHKAPDSKVVVIIFDSGAMVIAGAKEEDELTYMTFYCCELVEKLEQQRKRKK